MLEASVLLEYIELCFFVSLSGFALVTCIVFVVYGIQKAFSLLNV